MQASGWTRNICRTASTTVLDRIKRRLYFEDDEKVKMSDLVFPVPGGPLMRRGTGD
jgi:hypothetical protein